MHDVGARWYGHCLQSGCEWVRFPPASFTSNVTMSFKPAAPRCILWDSDRCVPDMEFNDDEIVMVSSEVEHQTLDLAVTGSTPVPVSNRRR
jgi:hypothetical protein